MANINIPGRLHSVETGNIVTGADEVLDDNMGLKQQAINQQVDEAVTQLESSTSAMAERIEQVAHMKDKSVGLYSTLASLQAAHPTPEVGDWALVGDADPFAVYECSTAGTWAATGGTYSAGEIDLADYTTKAEFDELDAVVNGGSSETPATTKWKESGTMINYATGAEFTVSSQYYSASDFIQIPNGTSSIRLLALVIKPGESFNTQCGIAFYDSSQTYISGIQREEYDHGGSSTAGMAERTYNVPSGARYLRVTCMVSQQNAWYCYFVSSTGSGLVGRMNDAELNIDAAAELAQEAYDLAEDAGQIKPSHDVYRHATDPDVPLNYNSAKQGRATYTTVFSEDKKFNQFTVKAVKASAANTSVAWRLNVFANTNTANDYIPTRGDGLKGTTLKSGSVTVGDTAADVVVDLGEDITCPAGQQVVIYMMAAGGATIMLGRAATLQSDTHGSVYNSTGEWAGAWGNASPDANIGYSTCAPVLRYESAIMSREEIDNVIDRKIEEAAITVEDYKILLADNIYCFVGSEVNIYNHHVSHAFSGGNRKPLNYLIEWKAVTGAADVKLIEAGVRIRPTAAGKTQIKCTMFDFHDNILDEKILNVFAVAKDALTTKKNFLFVGSSWTQSWNDCLYKILSGTDTYNDAANVAHQRFTGTCPNFLGTQVLGGVHCEGHGGWTWKAFAYEDDPVISPDGSSDTEGTNPFWNPSTGKIDIAYYRNKLGMGNEHFDLVAWTLGGNDIARTQRAEPATVEEYMERIKTSIIPYLDTIVRAIEADNPDAIQIIPVRGNYQNKWVGYQNYLSYNSAHWEGVKSTYAYNLLVKEWVESFNAEKGAEKVVLTNAYMTCDPIYAIATAKIPISDRWAKVKGGGKELTGYNMSHPSAVGYYQLADELAAEIAGRLGTLNTTNTSIGYAEDGYYGNYDEEVVNGKGLPFDNYVTTGEPADSQKVSGVLTHTMPTILYYSRTNRFMARHPSTLKYYEDFAAKSLYMTDGHPKPDIVYWLGDVPYMYNGTTLVRLSEFIANVTARLTALENG